jgi:hypothetical protein
MEKFKSNNHLMDAFFKFKGEEWTRWRNLVINFMQSGISYPKAYHYASTFMKVEKDQEEWFLKEVFKTIKHCKKKSGKVIEVPFKMPY